MDNTGTTPTPYSQSDTTDSYSFDANNERNAITNAKIRSLSFNKAQGGTLTLGGANNTNGVLVIKDSGGTQRINFGYSGGTITNGNLVFVNDTGGTSIDNKGVVNTTLLTNAAASTAGGINQGFSGTVMVPFVGATLSFTTVRTNTILFFANCIENLAGGTVGTYILTVMQLDGSEIESTSDQFVPDAGGLRTIAFHTLQNVSAGTHSYVLGGYTNGTVLGNLYGFRMTYLIIGA